MQSGRLNVAEPSHMKVVGGTTDIEGAVPHHNLMERWLAVMEQFRIEHGMLSSGKLALRSQ